MLVKIYLLPVDGQKHYSPPEIIGTQTVHCAGKLDPAHISTSFAERRNFLIRTGLISLGPTIKLDHFSGGRSASGPPRIGYTVAQYLDNRDLPRELNRLFEVRPRGLRRRETRFTVPTGSG